MSAFLNALGRIGASASTSARVAEGAKVASRLGTVGRGVTGTISSLSPSISALQFLHQEDTSAPPTDYTNNETSRW